MCKFTAVYDVYCEANGINNPTEEKGGYSAYLELRDRIEPIIERNREKLDAVRNKLREGR